MPATRRNPTFLCTALFVGLFPARLAFCVLFLVPVLKNAPVSPAMNSFKKSKRTIVPMQKESYEADEAFKAKAADGYDPTVLHQLLRRLHSFMNSPSVDSIAMVPLHTPNRSDTKPQTQHNLPEFTRLTLVLGIPGEFTLLIPLSLSCLHSINFIPLRQCSCRP